MQKFLQVSSSFVLALVFFCAGVSEVAQAATSPATVWHGYAQYYRNQLIVNAAKSYKLGDDVGLDCKNWARAVVLKASENVVSLPPTNTTSCWLWKSSSNVRAVNVSPNPYQTANLGSILKPGQIIQAKIWFYAKTPGNPYTEIEHTMIVVSSSATSGVKVRDSNFSGTNKVGEHLVEWAKVIKFTVYEIL